MSSDFIHLHTKSHYSLLSALPKIPELVAEAKKHGMPALALTDSGNLYGAIQFYKQCKKQNIKPILGVDFYVAGRDRHEKQQDTGNLYHRLVLLAKNEAGYKNLIKLVTYSFLEGFYHKPRIDNELLEKYGSDLIAITPSFGGDVAELINEKPQKAEERLESLKKIFGENNVFIEITHHAGIESHQKKMEGLVELARKTNTPIVAAHNIFYLDPDDKVARNTLLSIQSRAEARGKLARGEDDFSFKSPNEMEKNFKDFPDAIKNTKKIADMCNLEIELGKWKFPHYEIPENSTHDDELKKIVYEGLSKRDMDPTEDVKKRIEYELEVIKDKGYAPYFLTVADILRFARENEILSTIRGSVAGSLVTYLSGITNVDPLEYRLPFERFLNPERPSAPDIDMDFADDRRDEVIEYTKEKYGADKVAQIGTFGTMLARGVVRDVARALGYSYNDGDRIAKLIPFGSQGFPMTIERAMEMEPELGRIYEEEEEVKEIIDIAKKIEGNARHISIHAAGVVISPDPLIEHVPLQYDPKGEGRIITQYDMYSVGEDDVGLLKFDFLGLKNLSILAHTVKLVEKLYDKKVDIENIPIDDKKTFEMLARGETMSVFQMSGQAMTKFLKELKPTTIHDINAMVALYRPGPMEFIPEYIRRKHNPELIDYPHEDIKEDLERSYGLLVYQDDVMMTAIKLAGYSWLEADKLRKAMGKKIPKLMAEQEEKFKKGCMESGISEKLADNLWQRIKPFAAYGFNKAHAASYGRVAYQTAYMKANFPAAYMSAVLTADAGDVEKVAEIIGECKRMGIEIMPPDINESFGNFTVIEEGKNPKIRFGLYSIKNFGRGIAQAIIEERKSGGEFKSIVEFLDRIKDKNLNRKSLESLIRSGAMDELGERGAMLKNLEDLLTYNRDRNKHGDSQDSLFGLMADKSSLPKFTLKDAPPASPDEKLVWEKELLGLYITGHPLEKFRERFQKSKTNIKSLKESGINGNSVIIAGIIEDVSAILTKKGEKMAFLKIADLWDSIEAVAFPGILNEHKDLLKLDSCIVCKGKFSKRNGEASIVIDKVKELK